MARRIEPAAGRLPLAVSAALLLASASAAVASTEFPRDVRRPGEPRTEHPARTASPFRLSITRSEYALAAGSLAGLAPAGETAPSPASRFSPLIERQARNNGVDPKLVHAVIRAESAYRPDAVSPKGAIGLMQLMPATARRFGVVDPEQPESNVGAGSAYLRLLLDRFNSLPLALAAYNAGEGTVARYGNRVPPYAETLGYVQRILRDYGNPGAQAGRPSPAYLPGLRLSEADYGAYRLIVAPRR